MTPSQNPSDPLPPEQPQPKAGKKRRVREDLCAAQVFYVIIGLILFLTAGAFSANAPHGEPERAQVNAYAALGFSVAGGLCLVASAIVYHAWSRKT